MLGWSDHQRFAGAERRQPAALPGAVERRNAERRIRMSDAVKGVVETSLNVGGHLTSENAEIICPDPPRSTVAKTIVEMLTA